MTQCACDLLIILTEDLRAEKFLEKLRDRVIETFQLRYDNLFHYGRMFKLAENGKEREGQVRAEDTNAYLFAVIRIKVKVGAR